MTPDWVRDAIFYQIFPDRFRNGDPGNDPSQVQSWGKLPDHISFSGGDLPGIVEKLDYLQRLGVTTLYLTPIFEAPSNHKYDTTNYFRVDPAFGGNAALVELVEALHSRGMRIVLDGVFNHCSEEHPFFQDVIRKGTNSPYWDWFTVSGDGVVREPSPNYACWAGVSSMPEWNHDNPKTRDYLLSVVRHWIRKYGIDGWRLDTVEYLPPDFVKDVRHVAKEENPDTYILGEVMGLATSWFKHRALDGVMHYKLWEALVSFFAKEDWDAARFAGYVTSIWRSYPDEKNYTSYTLLGSHDKPRFLTLADGDVRRLILAAAFLFTFPGAPAIYYGDEIGMEGGEDPDCRRTFPWEEGMWNKEVLETFRRLIHLRAQEVCLRRGAIEFVHPHDRLNVADKLRRHLVFCRKTEEEEIVVAVNAGETDHRVALPSPGQWVDLLSQERVTASTDLSPMGFRILKRLGSV
jgi:glycosidase